MEWKSHGILKRDTPELQKGKKQLGKQRFLSFSEHIYFLSFFERRYASKCWTHKVFRLGCGNRKSKDSTSHTAKTVIPTQQYLDNQKNTLCYWIELAEKAGERIMKRMLEKHESSNSKSFLNLAIRILFNCIELIEVQGRSIRLWWMERKNLLKMWHIWSATNVMRSKLLQQKVRIKNITESSQNSQLKKLMQYREAKQNCLHCPLKNNKHINEFVKQGYFLWYNQLGHGKWQLVEICFGLSRLFTDRQIQRQQ